MNLQIYCFKKKVKHIIIILFIYFIYLPNYSHSRTEELLSMMNRYAWLAH